MILDKQAELATTVAFDLETVRPGPGEPLKMAAIGVDASIAITTCATEGGTYTALTTVLGTDGLVEFELPSNALRYIKATFAAGEIVFTLPGNQTNT